MDDSTYWTSDPRRVNFEDTWPRSFPVKYQIGYFPLCYKETSRAACPTSYLDLTNSLAQNLYPWNFNSWSYEQLAFTMPPWPEPLNTAEQRQKLLQWIQHQNLPGARKRVAWLGPAAQAAPDGSKSILGTSDARYNGGAGQAAWIVDVADNTLSRRLAHELGHLFGLHHATAPADTAKGCGPQAKDANPTAWTFPDNTIQQSGFNRFYFGTFFPGDQYFDLMAYCPPDKTWISPFHYKQLFAAIQAEFLAEIQNVANSKSARR